MKERDRRLIKNTTILSIGTICTKGMMFIMTPFFTRWLTQEEYGTFDLIVTYVSLLIPLVTFEIGQAAFRFLMREDENKKEIIGNTFIISIFGTIVSIILIVLIGFFYSPIRHIMDSIILYVIAEVFYLSLTMIMRGIKKLDVYTIANVLYVFIMTLFVFMFVKIMKLNLRGVIFGYALGYIVSDIYMIVKLVNMGFLTVKKINIKKVQNMLKYSLPLIPCDISWWIMNVSDRTIVSIFLGTASNAILSVANKIPNMCQSIFNVFHLSWQENAIETLNDEDRNLYYSKVMNNMLRIITSICLVILSFNFIIFDILFTKEYFPGYYQVPILISAIIFSMLAQFLGSLYIANMNSKKSGWTTLIAAIVNIIIHLILIKYINLYAASISTLISYLLLFFIRYVDINKKIKLSIDRNSILILIALIYFFISTYLNITFINYLNIALSIGIFIACNKNYLLKLKR